MSAVELVWLRYRSLTEARRDFGTEPCVYVQVDAAGRPLRVGKASFGLNVRYRGGNAWALDAAMHGSGNQVFVAGVGSGLVVAVEAVLSLDLPSPADL
jgi:hypothetical protein